MPRLEKNPLGFLHERGGGEELVSAPAEHLSYTPEEATRRDRFNSALVSYTYLHWLQTGASRTISAYAFKLAIKHGEVLSDMGLQGEHEQGEAHLSTLLSAPPSAPDEGR